MRQYEPIWNKLKALSRTDAASIGVRIAADQIAHRRIIKAVKKEKYQDIAFRFTLESIGCPDAYLSIARTKTTITFFLTYKPCQEDF